MARTGTITRLFLITVLIAMSAHAEDWPRWRGPRGDGISTETEWSPGALTGSPDILWRVRMGTGHSSVAVRGDRVYSMGSSSVAADGDTTFTDVIYCLDAHTGKEIWRYPYPAQRRGWPGPGSTPTVDGDAVYTIGRDGDLYCFDAGCGRVRWKKNLVSEEISQTPGWGFCASPILDGDYLILNAGQSGAVLEKRTGKLVWKSEPGAANLTSPILLTQGGKRIAAVLGERDFVAREIASGEILWSEAWPNTDNDPIVFDDKILLTGYRQCKMLEVGEDGVQTLWERNRLRAEAWLNFVVVDGHAYGFCRVRRSQPLQCIDMSTGEVKWSEDLGVYGSLMAAGDKLIIQRGGGELIIAQASPEAYRVLSSAQIFDHGAFRPPEGDGMPDWCWTCPVLAHGKIYTRSTHGDLVCVDMTI